MGGNNSNIQLIYNIIVHTFSTLHIASLRLHIASLRKLNNLIGMVCTSLDQVRLQQLIQQQQQLRLQGKQS
jgi:hypothetical protein